MSGGILQPIGSSPPAPPSPSPSSSSSGSSSSESTISLSEDRANPSTSHNDSHHDPNHPNEGTAGENDNKDANANANANAPVLIASTGPILPVSAGTNESDTTAVMPGPRTSRRTIVIRASGESGRRGFHPWRFLRILFTAPSRVSKLCNLLWPLVPVAIALQYANHSQELLGFIFSYLAIIPCANLIGFSGAELAHKLPHVWGIMINTICESVTEIILIMVLLKRGKIAVVQAAILGSILATMLLCLGLCFFIGGIYHKQQRFDSVVSEASSGLLLAGGVALAVPSIFYHSLFNAETEATDHITNKTHDISRIIAIFLMVAYFVYLFFQFKSHHSILNAIFEDAALTLEKEDGTTKPSHHERHKFTLTECAVALAVSVALVTIISIGLADRIGYIVEYHNVSDPFLGLILVPLCEKAAEHLNAVEEAYENRNTFALSHVLSATIQTTFFTAPLAVIVGWGIGVAMDFNFGVFNISMLILGIVAVGNFTRDQQSNYLEGFLCLIIYAAIAVGAWYYPNPLVGGH